MIRFQKHYFLAAFGLLLVEIGIALFAHDSIIRPYGGDFLAVIFLYCLVRSWVLAPAGRVTLAVLLVAYLIEIAQYFNFLAILGLQHSRLARVVLGSRFGWGDMLAYTAGALLAVAVEQYRSTAAATACRSAA